MGAYRRGGDGKGPGTPRGRRSRLTAPTSTSARRTVGPTHRAHSALLVIRVAKSRPHTTTPSASPLLQRWAGRGGMWLLVGAGSALLPPSGGPAKSLIMPVDEQNAFPAYAPSLVHSHKTLPGVLNLLALSPEQRREKRKRNRKMRELEKQQTAGSGNINLISAQTFGSRHPALPGDSVDAFAGASAAPRMAAPSRWTQLLAIIDEQRKEGSWAEDRAGPRDAAQHLAAMKLLAVKEPATTHSAFTMTPFQLLHVAAGAAFSAPLAVVGGLTTAFRSWSSKTAETVPPAPAAQQQQESQTVAEAEPVAYWIGSNGPKEMVVAESVAQTTVAHRKPRRQQQQQEKSLNTALKAAKTDKQAIPTTQTIANTANKTAEAEEIEAAAKRLAIREKEAAAEKAEKEAAEKAEKAAAEKAKADASAAKRAEAAEEKRKVERKADAAAAIAQKVASYRERAAKAESNYAAEDQAERAKTAADKVAALTKDIERKVSPQTALRRNETDVSKAQEAIRIAEKEVAAKAAQEKQAALRLEQIKKIVAQRSKERDAAKRKVAQEAAAALADVQNAEEAARAKMDAAKAVHATAKAKAGLDAAEALSVAKKEAGTPAAKSAAKARAEASLKLFAAATAKREAAIKAKEAADARAAAAKKQAAMRATLVATEHKATATAESKPEHKETAHANKQDALEHSATSLVANPASKPAEAVPAAKGGSEFPAVGRFLGEAKKVNSGRWAQLATLSTKVAALKNLQEKDSSQ